MNNEKIRIAITQGDANGTGYELIFKTFAEPESLELCTPVIYGSPKVASYHNKALGMGCKFSIINHAEEVRDGRLNLLACFDEDVKVELGKPSEMSALVGDKALERALADGKAGLYDALVCGPTVHGPLRMGSLHFPGLASTIGKAFGAATSVLPVFQNGLLRVALAFGGGMRETVDGMTEENIYAKLKALHSSLRRDFLLSNPRMALLALNPENSVEEEEILIPTIKRLSNEGVQVFGPYQADAFYAKCHYDAFDAVLAMYHDQAMLPIRMLTETPGAVLLGGLPLVCTLPDLTDAASQMSQAGKGEADDTPLRNAVYLAIDVVNDRRQYDEARENPLPRLYKERPDSGEKLRFAIPKKKEEG